MHFLPDIRIWRVANDYQEAASLLNECNHGWASAINAALAVEIYLKSFLSKEVRSTWETGVFYKSHSECERGHDLKNLYYKIPDTLRDLLDREFSTMYPDTDLPAMLEYHKDVFFRARYRFEQDFRVSVDNSIVYLAV